MPEDKTAAANPQLDAEPPALYIASCGVLCDVFWWARKAPVVQNATPSPAPASPDDSEAR